MAAGPSTTFIDYPNAKAYDVPYQAPPEPSNPVIRGRLLTVLANIVANAPLIPGVLYNNAGFPKLRTVKHLESVEARFNPCVIRVDGDADSERSDLGKSYTTSKIHEELIKVSSTSAQKQPGSSFYSIADYHSAYKSGHLTPTDVVEALLPLIRRDIENRNVHSTAFIDSKVDLVRRAAEESTKRWKAGRQMGVLDGVPFAVKDEMDVKGYKTYLGTVRDFTGGGAKETSFCARMLEEVGAVCVGKTSMHELGMDTTNNNPNWGTPLNPYNKGYYCGGSSGGSAYSVAAGLVPFAIGADGGGSIRLPASFCGLFGLKPSHGRVSITPTPCFANTTVVQGPLAATMLDLAISYRVLSQPDAAHPTSIHFTPSPTAPLFTPRKKLLGICKPWLDRADPIVQDLCTSALQYLTNVHDYNTIDINIPYLHEAQLAHAITILTECASATPEIGHLTPANKILMRIGHYTPATDWLLAQRLRNLVMQHLSHLFHTYPGLLIITPTTPTAGWKIQDGELACGMSDANAQIRSMEYVWMANFTGVPCLQVPVGYVDDGGEGVPVGMCAHGEWGSEEELIAFGFDAEMYLGGSGGEGLEGGRKMPPEGRWVDILGSAGKGV